MPTILFVCTGNTCRSPMAESLLRLEAGRRGLDVSVSSAGTMAVDGTAASPGAIAAARRRGADLSLHRSRSVNRDVLDRADLVIAMSPRHVHALRDHPDIVVKTRVITEFLPAGHALYGTGVADPYGGDDEEYEHAARVIELCVHYVLDAVEEA